MGDYAVVATFVAPNYEGTATGTLSIRLPDQPDTENQAQLNIHIPTP